MTREEAIDKVYGMIGTAEQHEALDFLVPEIRELRESYDRQQEDERIRKEIISALKFANVDGVYDKHITYLENQKPSFRQIHDGVIWNNGLRTGIELGKQEEQKPSIFPPGFGEARWNPISSVEQKPAEWSEEEKDKLNSIERLIVNANAHGNYLIGDKEATDLQHFIRSIVKPTTNLAEWSEEDEKIAKEIEEELWYPGDFPDYPSKEESELYDDCQRRLNWFKNKLKSLRTQSKKELSIEKAIQWLDDTFYFLDNSSGRGRDCEITTHDFDSLEEMYDSFRKAVTVDSEPSWKPSEE